MNLSPVLTVTSPFFRDMIILGIATPDWRLCRTVIFIVIIEKISEVPIVFPIIKEVAGKWKVIH